MAEAPVAADTGNPAVNLDRTKAKDEIGQKLVTPGPLESKIAAGQINESDLRLVIEEDKGSYIYKTVNRVTGETVSQYPREDVVRMRDSSDYTAGRIVNAKA